MSTCELPLVSIVIPAYNHEKYVQETIQSVIAQDYPRIELIVIDDGSKDSTWAKIEEMRTACEKRFERVVMLSQDNAGTAMTLGRLFDLAKGEFVGCIASDDAFTNCAVSTLIKPLQVNPAIGLVVGINEVMDGKGRRCFWDDARNIVYDEDKATIKTLNDFIMKVSGVDYNSPAFGSYEKMIRINHVPNGAIIRRRCICEILPFSSDAPLEDWWMHLQLTKICKYKYIPVTTFRYRWHGSNTMLRNNWITEVTKKTISYEAAVVWKSRQQKFISAINSIVTGERFVFRIHYLCHVVCRDTHYYRYWRIGAKGHYITFWRRCIMK